MSIQTTHSESQFNPAGANLDSLLSTQFSQKLVSTDISPEIKAIIEQLANQPLLLEKLILQQTQGATITLKPTGSLEIQPQATDLLQNTKPSENIQLNFPKTLPTALNELLNQLNSNPESLNKLSINLTNNQQIKINIELSQQSQLSNLSLLFNRAELSPKGNVLLSQFIPAKLILASPDSTNTNTEHLNTITTVNLKENIGKIAANLIDASNTKTINTTKASNSASIYSELNDSSSQLTLNLKRLLNDLRVIEQLFTQADNPKNAKILNQLITSTHSVNKEIHQLLSQLNKSLPLNDLLSPNENTNTKNLVNRIISSGNLFENSLKQRANKNDVVGITSRSLIPTDSKLLMNQVKTQLEKLLVEINRYSEKPVTLAQVESVSKQLLAPSKELTPLEKHHFETLSKNASLKVRQQNELLQSLVKTVNSLKSSVNLGIQKIENNQLHSLKSEQFNLQQFLVDLPIKQNGMIDSFEMRFENKKNNNQALDKFWKVVVRFDLEPLGPMFAEIQFKNSKISTHLFAEKKETAELINYHLPTLKKSLFSAGVDVNQVAASQGNIPENLRNETKMKIDTHV